MIASIICSFKEEDWTKLAKISEEAGADALELNFKILLNDSQVENSSHKIIETTNIIRNICKWVRNTVKIPFFAKLTPNVTDILDFAVAGLKIFRGKIKRIFLKTFY